MTHFLIWILYGHAQLRMVTIDRAVGNSSRENYVTVDNRRSALQRTPMHPATFSICYQISQGKRKRGGRNQTRGCVAIVLFKVSPLGGKEGRKELHGTVPLRNAGFQEVSRYTIVPGPLYPLLAELTVQESARGRTSRKLEKQSQHQNRESRSCQLRRTQVTMDVLDTWFGAYEMTIGELELRIGTLCKRAREVALGDEEEQWTVGYSAASGSHRLNLAHGGKKRAYWPNIGGGKTRVTRKKNQAYTRNVAVNKQANLTAGNRGGQWGIVGRVTATAYVHSPRKRSIQASKKLGGMLGAGRQSGLRKRDTNLHSQPASARHRAEQQLHSSRTLASAATAAPSTDGPTL
ncbi:hypothetical protein C8F01DRAFT_1075785 [Mycena amicta]|nr:hypothetical protein C8F01DRAFT_1075785 [Mycena amicta]